MKEKFGVQDDPKFKQMDERQLITTEDPDET